MKHRLYPFALVLALGAVAPAQESEAPQKQTQQAQPTLTAELRKARARAAMHNKRVLVVLPEDGKDLEKLIKRERSISRTFLYEFEVVSLNSELWKGVQRPSLVVQDAAGKTMATLSSDVFLDEGKVDGKALLAAVKPHFCAPVDAEKKLAAAKKLARKTGRNILIRFDAPW